MDILSERLGPIWRQKKTPVILRRNGKGEKLRLRLPYNDGNRKWIKNGRRAEPQWIKEGLYPYWEIPKAWFNDTVNRSLEQYGSIYIIQPYNEQEKCAPACQNAAGHECECSCMGLYHGSGNDGSWFEVSETFATRWSKGMLACRLLTFKPKR